MYRLHFSLQKVLLQSVKLGQFFFALSADFGTMCCWWLGSFIHTTDITVNEKTTLTEVTLSCVLMLGW